MEQKAKETLGYLVNGLSIALLFFLMFSLDVPDSLRPLSYLGWILLGSGIGLVVLSSVVLARNRGAGLIDWGVFGLVRHPMYVGAMLCFLSYFFFCPHWLILLISSINIAVVYGFILQGEGEALTRFGDAYSRYMESVPRMNLVAGMLRRLRSK